MNFDCACGEPGQIRYRTLAEHEKKLTEHQQNQHATLAELSAELSANCQDPNILAESH